MICLPPQGTPTPAPIHTVRYSGIYVYTADTVWIQLTARYVRITKLGYAVGGTVGYADWIQHTAYSGLHSGSIIVLQKIARRYR